MTALALALAPMAPTAHAAPAGSKSKSGEKSSGKKGSGKKGKKGSGKKGSGKKGSKASSGGKKGSGKKGSGKKGKKGSGKKGSGKKGSGKKGKKGSGKKGKKSKKANDAAAADPGVVKAGELLQSGQEKFELGDFEGAVDMWSEAYVGLPAGPEADQYRAVLAYQIAGACREAFKANHEIKYLQRAEHLLQEYLDGLSADDDEARTAAEEALAELRTQMEEEERAREIERQKSEASLEEMRQKIRDEERRAAERDAQEVEKDTGPTPEDIENNRRGKNLQIAGAVLLGVGSIAMGVGLGYGLARGRSLDQDGFDIMMAEGPDADGLAEIREQGVTANYVAIGSGAGGGALVAVGVVLVAVGTVKRRKRSVAVAPSLGRGFAGLSVRGRF